MMNREIASKIKKKANETAGKHKNKVLWVLLHSEKGTHICDLKNEEVFHPVQRVAPATLAKLSLHHYTLWASPSASTAANTKPTFNDWTKKSTTMDRTDDQTRNFASSIDPSCSKVSHQYQDASQQDVPGLGKTPKEEDSDQMFSELNNFTCFGATFVSLRFRSIGLVCVFNKESDRSYW